MRLALVAALAALAACDGVLGLHATQLADAYVADAKPPPVCPQLGTAPMFSGQFGSVPARAFDSYSISTTTGMAAGRRVSDATIGMGAIDGALAPISTDDPNTMTQVTIAAEGDLLFAVAFDNSGSRYELDTLQPNGSAWQRIAVYPAGTASLGGYPITSPPSRGPDRRMLVVDTNGAPTTLVELADAGRGQWSQRDSYALPSGINGLLGLALTEDALRALAWTPSMAFYLDRPTPGDRFVTAQPMPTVPANTSSETYPFLREDCGRIYFSALGTILYIEQ